MAAHEEKNERVVLLRLDDWSHHLGIEGRLGFSMLSRKVAPQLIGEPVRSNPNKPAEGVVGNPLRRPLHGRRQESFLNGILRRSEIAKAAHDRRENLGCKFSQQPLAAFRKRIGLRHIRSAGVMLTITCRTSIGMLSGSPPTPGAAEAFAAIA